LSGKPQPAEERWEKPLWELTSPRPDVPLLLSGHRSAAILSGAGDLALKWGTRGTPIEWGGAYAQGVRLTGPWTLGLGRPDERPSPLSASLVNLTAWRHGLHVGYRGEGWTAVQQLVVPHDDPAVTRTLFFSCFSERELALDLTMTLEPFLLPVLMEGLRPHRYSIARRPLGFALSAEGYSFEFLTSQAPSQILVDGRPFPATTESLPVGAIQLTWPLRMEPAEQTRFDWVVWGGIERMLQNEPDQGVRVLSDALFWRAHRQESQADWWKERPVLHFPQDPSLERAAMLATGAMEALAHWPQLGMVGFVAGFPWYYALWYRDIAWMLPAALWLGDYDWCKATLKTCFSFQSRAHIPILGADVGELPMQVSPGPIFLYGTSDTTLHYPALAHRFLQHAGPMRSAFLKELLPQMLDCLTWAERKVNPRTGLFTNGGEIQEMADASAHGRVQYGFEAKDTTIWDSTDRRAHAIDVQVLHARALRGMDAVQEVLGGIQDPRFRDHADRIQREVLQRYDWPQEGYLADTLAMDGTPVPRLRPNALIAVMDGWTSPVLGQRMVQRATQEDLTTAWGVRTLSNRDPQFDPLAYHDGQVWTIATAWAAHAALSAGQGREAMVHLHTIAKILQDEHGLANECYHGLTPDPFNSCFLLGLSIGPFLTALFEGLWGLAISSPTRTLTVAPAFPPEWQEASLEHLRVGDSYLDLHWKEGTLEVRLVDGPPVTVRSASGQSISAGSGGPVRLDVPSRLAKLA
jgi:glycogen debranching enzyme